MHDLPLFKYNTQIFNMDSLNIDTMILKIEANGYENRVDKRIETTTWKHIILYKSRADTSN